MGKCKSESVGGNTNEFIRFKEEACTCGGSVWYVVM